MRHDLFVICARCPDRQKVCRGACLCGVDWDDITVHATEGLCPAGRYPVAGLGDLLARALHWTGIGPLAKRAAREIRRNNAWLLPDGVTAPQSCGCLARQRALNQAVPFTWGGGSTGR